uniref:Secreted protein n=1 Tax=Bursaphelenchus xylophilus TaxID=6326 RepID=A0A1I7SU87_BURXY
MFAHLLRLVLGVKNGQFSEHSHMSSFESECSFEKANQLLEVAGLLIIIDQFLQFVSMNNNMKTTDLSQPEFLLINTSKADLLPCFG